MELDREDVFPPPDPVSLRPAATAPEAEASALWPDPRTARVPVVVKKRRLAGTTTAPNGRAAGEDARAGSGAADERRPRVFVLPREPQPEAAGAPLPEAAAATAPPDGAAADPVPRRRHRPAPWRRPSPVVHIVVAAPANVDADGAAVPDAAAPALPEPPAVDGYREVQAALARLRRHVEQARAASAFVILPAGRRHRAG